jgi:catechol 2,3-dioxygenase-like lactoylglutathione lyase family enzyme
MNEFAGRSVRFQRVNYLVSNLERALLMYRDVLGLQVEFVIDSESDSYSYPVFEIDSAAALRFAVLSSPTQARVMALTEVTGVVLAEQRLPRRSAIVLEIEDIDGVKADCARHGFKVYPEERLETHDGRIGREVGLVDDDGNLIVIYFVPASQ